MERILVERAMRGDEAAFDALVDRVGDQLHSVARRILRDTHLAEDATQRALLDVGDGLLAIRTTEFGDPSPFELSQGVAPDPDRHAADLVELQAIVDSIRIEPWPAQE
jgi:hypothetical protein